MRVAGAELSIELFAPATWTSVAMAPESASEYPGPRPTGSWRLSPDGTLDGLDAVEGSWQVRATGELVDFSGRRLLLAYGSNPDPGKLLSRPWLFGGDVVIALRAAVFGWAAAWCDARRQADRSVVATLVRDPGRAEVHPVLALTDHQMAAVDDWEGHPHTYRRQDHVGAILLESGQWADDVQVYLGTPENRPALLREGRPLLCAEVSRTDADLLVRP